MYLNNSYLALLGFIKFCFNKVVYPQSLKDNIIGSLIGIGIIFSIIMFCLKFLV